MKTIQIQRLIEDINKTLHNGNRLLYVDEVPESQVLQYYSDVLKTLAFILSQELK